MTPEANEVLASVETSKTVVLTDRLSDYLQDQAEYLSNQVWSNLLWIAATAVVDFGVEPTFDNVKYEALQIAMDPDEAVYDRDAIGPQEETAEPGAEDATVRVHGQQVATAGAYGAKRSLSGKQYESIVRNSEFVTKNLAILKDLAEMGFVATSSQEDRFRTAIIDRRERLNNWKATDDERKHFQHLKNQRAGKEAAERISVL